MIEFKYQKKLDIIMFYNIAFIPNNCQQFINYAHKSSFTDHSFADKYLIGRGNSIPHISLSHFMCQKDKLDAIWQAVKNLMIPNLNISFEHQRCKTYSDGPYWISLMPDHIEQLHQIHWSVANIIKHPLNSAFENYDPHMTLFNSFDHEACMTFNVQSQVTPVLTDEFRISLGTIDLVGQITGIVYD